MSFCIDLLSPKYDNGEEIVATYDNNKKTYIIASKKTARLPKKYKYPIIIIGKKMLKVYFWLQEIGKFFLCIFLTFLS